MHKPVSTYRIQFHKDFTFRNFKAIIPYLHQLGVQTIYASPIFEASPGSMHGYDTVNPHRINPEIGTEKELMEISRLLKKNGMGWIQDIVPNHMAYHETNAWLMDVLEKGSKSKYIDYFDINWAKEGFEPVMAPFLGSDLEEVLNDGEIRVVKSGGSYKLDYSNTLWPLNSISTRKIDKLKNLNSLNKDKKALRAILNEQYYRLCNWQETDRRINYRRFFTVNNLICLNMQHPEVFQDYHKYILEMIEQGVFQGLRIDHIDGLYDPEVYLQRLRNAAGEEAYIVVEKILEAGEELPQSWPIQGTTGYEFLATVNNLFTNGNAEADFSKFYQKISRAKLSIMQQIHEKKRAFLENHMGGELSNLCTFFYELELSEVALDQRPDPEGLKHVLGEFLVHCPIYRFYGMHFPLKGSQKNELEQIFKELKKLGDLDGAALQLLRQLLFKENVSDQQVFQDKITRFFKRCMQFSGPLMAKGVEDTLMYTYNRFVGNNEVGDSPEGFGISIKTFHQRMVERQKKWPVAMNATATHDTKRGEDVRARLNVLTDQSKRWVSLIKAGHKYNRHLKSNGQPDANDEYLIYQTISGSLPMPGEKDMDYQSRITAYLEKALREAKRRTTWAEPGEEYELAAKTFAINLLDQPHPFHDQFTDFQGQLADFGIINSLAQLVLKFTCPGIPDVYQGTELWDLSLVDPDNRRPVNYILRENWLKAFSSNHIELSELWNTRATGKIKLWMQSLLMKLRKSREFTKASYLPLKVKGRYRKHIMAFARVYQREWTVVVLPVQLAAINDLSASEITALDWDDTRVILPEEAPESWTNVISREEGRQKKGIPISAVFTQIPLAVLELKHPGTTRSAGVLMHLSSLPSPFGIGDMGPQAFSFVDFLSASHQKYWQLLPLNPVTSEQAYSPYSSHSSMAGNVLLISPELLMADGLLKEADLEPFREAADRAILYHNVEERKSLLLKTAYANFLDQGDESILLRAYHTFVKEEAAWLEDFALFSVIRDLNPGKEWIDWPEPLRTGGTQAIREIMERSSDQIAEVQWLQFIFFKQWGHLKEYCHANGVKLFGDLPFYVSYDSADVWANPKLFKLDAEGRRLGLAGVPPDYFNADGQLWGMPVFDWEAMKADGYSWWIKRLRKNLDLYDLLRLDHFRAFSAFWEVAEGSATAVNGIWVAAPGRDFFKTILKEFGKLPFVAEDLGEIDAPVYTLRDEFELPGMKVLQFAFGPDMPYSVHIPHQYPSENCVVYTGTHDNNTTLGWYSTEASKKDRKHLRQYIGKSVKDATVNQELIRIAYASVARIAIVPIQDILDLDGSARMNVPSSVDNNWVWRMKSDAITKAHRRWLAKLTKRYGRM